MFRVYSGGVYQKGSIRLLHICLRNATSISPLVNLFTVFVFQPRVLADGGGIDPNPVF